MREIKFRWYDKMHKKMWFGYEAGESIGEWTFQNFFDPDNELRGILHKSEDVGFHKPYVTEVELLPIQYTGLKDKNGVEICEGDIVKQEYSVVFNTSYDPVTLGFVDQESEEGYHIGEVVIIPSKGVCMKKPLRYVLDEDKHEVSNQYKNVSGYRCEVIGNIYANPELLEVNE